MTFRYKLNALTCFRRQLLSSSYLLPTHFQIVFRLRSGRMSSERENKLKMLKENVKEYPDFPKPGILFRDIFSVLRKPELFEMLESVLVEAAKEIPNVDCVAGLDSRGFLFGPLIALDLKLPFVPIRKKGKLPGDCASYTYKLEYGEDTLQIHSDIIKKGERVLLVDDLLATGGTLGASCALISQVGAKVVASIVVMELCDLKGREKLPCEVHSLLKF